MKAGRGLPINLHLVHAMSGVERMAICGACGTERLVTPFMRRDFDQQFRARPGEPADSFYCGCQNDDGFDL